MSLVVGLQTGVTGGLAVGLNPTTSVLAVLPVVRESGSTIVSSATPATASFTPTANVPIYACVYARAAATPSIPTAAGNGLTWVLVDDETSSTGRMAVFRAMGATPSAGALTFTFGGAVLAATWIIVECPGAATGGTDASAATVQFVSSRSGSAVTTKTNTLAALASANNVHLCFVGVQVTSGVVNDALFAELADVTATVASGNMSLSAQWLVNQPANTSTFASSPVAMVSVEVARA